ncbi:MAG: Holliday junction branch migration protein RuvA [Coriobacteriales bacterium]|jgi:Holliday junction DNA helicase RuvA|nr:Holliday junction branch migration protein RuvA [Coriobacteriales bacterium]
MIASIQGELIARDENSAVVDVGGVGFLLLMPTGALAGLGAIGSLVQVPTLLQVRADSLTLYGFGSVAERQLFEQLTSVSGVGAKYALAILSAYAPSELTAIIAGGDSARLTQVSGIGKKTAQRIILELKGVITDEFGSKDGPVTNGVYVEAMAALEAMGFSATEAKNALAAAGGDPEDTGAAVRAALRYLG